MTIPEHLRERLKASDERVVRLAVLECLKGKLVCSVPILVELLGHTNVGVAGTAAEALGEIGDTSALAALQRTYFEIPLGEGRSHFVDRFATSIFLAITKLSSTSRLQQYCRSSCEFERSSAESELARRGE